MAKKVAVAAPPAPPKKELSAEAVRLINEIWEHLELIQKHDISHSELQEVITVDGQLMDEYQLRALALKLRSSYRKSGEKEPAAYEDPSPESE